MPPHPPFTDKKKSTKRSTFCSKRPPTQKSWLRAWLVIRGGDLLYYLHVQNNAIGFTGGDVEKNLHFKQDECALTFPNQLDSRIVSLTIFIKRTPKYSSWCYKVVKQLLFHDQRPLLQSSRE